MEKRADLSTVLINLALRRFPPVLEDEERHPDFVRRFARSRLEVVQPAGWLYLALYHPEVMSRFRRRQIDRMLRPLRWRYESDHGKPVPLV
jgi:hypothetical protein